MGRPSRCPSCNQLKSTHTFGRPGKNCTGPVENDPEQALEGVDELEFIAIFIWRVELFTDIPCRKNRRAPPLQRLFYSVAIISENNAVVLKITSVLSAESVNGSSIFAQHAGHVFESRSRIGRILLIALLKLWLPKIRRSRQKTRLFFPSSPSRNRCRGRSRFRF